MSSDQVVRIVINGLSAKVFSPFEAREAIKTLPRRLRSWDAEEKCWVVQVGALAELTRALRLEGFTVISRASGSGGSTPPPRARRGADTWADGMYAALGTALGDKAYKALLPVLHPDRGGDTEAMQDLNAARDRMAVK